MNCQDVRHLLHPFSDGELDLIRNVQIEEHVAECVECGERLKQVQSLRAAISSPSLRYKAPASLLARVRPPDFPASRTWSRIPTRWMVVAASLLMLVGLPVVLTGWLFQPAISVDDQIAQWIIADHVRSTQVDHLTDVASTDRHTVKPWFQGKLNFACQVPDLASEGYPLSGGRLDYVIDHPVAGLVYHRRLHAINVFTWSATNGDEKPMRRLTRQ